ncbi:hypothetical protein ABEB36_011423 [Hypothenemus hampei]|uniref:Vitellogenin n=1 Tax=Hypothenemus hampei TaxID=57062 RepID=A0ABD1EI87_HYPHA
MILLGLALAARHSSWKDGTEYVYQVRGRSLTSLHDLADQYSGIFLQANLHIVPRSDSKLQAWISNPQYAQVHTHLPNGWNTELSENQLNYKQLALSDKPFQIINLDGVIKGLVVERGISHWEVNVIKSVVSQLQLDLHGKNALQSSMTSLPTEDHLEGVFVTMEESVTGKMETLYDIHQIPEYILQSEPRWSPKGDQGRNQVYEIVKSKNYTNSQDMPTYHYGLFEMELGEPTSNQLGEFFTRHSSSRVRISGKLSKYIIHSCETVNKIMINPTATSQQKGSAVSTMNLALIDLKSYSQEPKDLADPVEIGNLVYSYENPFGSNEARRKRQSRRWDSSEENEDSWSRINGFADQMIKKTQQDESDEHIQHQERPSMDEAPESPLLPYFVGYQGKSIKDSRNFDLKQKVIKLIDEISRELAQPEEALNQSTLSKYTMLVSLLRLMNQQEIKDISQQLYQQDQRPWGIFRDAVAQTGTGPALLNIEQWISNGKIEKQEAGDIIASMARATRFPTEEYMKKFFTLLQKSEVKHQEALNETALIAFCKLVNKVYVNRQQSRNQFPVYSFNSFNTKEGKDFIKSTVIPYLAEQLSDAIYQADTRKIHAYIRALGFIGHKNIVQVFEPYLEGEKQVSQFQRMLMVLSLDKLVVSYPQLAQALLHRIYQNVGEVPEIRVAAVYQLMRTNPPAEMLQHMAENTQTDVQEEVNAAVKSAIETACQLDSAKSQTLRQAAESARGLLTRKEYSVLRSSNLLKDFILEQSNVEFKQNLVQIGSTDDLLPKGVKYSARANVQGLKHYFLNLQAMVSNIKELVSTLETQNEEYGHQMPSILRRKLSRDVIPESLTLDIPDKEQLEGFIYGEVEGVYRFWSFDNETIQRMPQVIRQQQQKFQDGKEIKYAKLRNLKEMAVSFPTEMGLPFLYTYDVPTFVQYDGKIKIRTSPSIKNKLAMPREISAKIQGSLTVNGKAQCHLTLLTPFDHQIYVAGFERNLQVHVPTDVKVEINVEKSQAKFELKMKEHHENARLFHYSSWPFTSRSEVMSLTPVGLRENTHHIRIAKDEQPFNFAMGGRDTGLKLHIWGQHPQKLNILQIVNLAKSQGISRALQKVLDDSTLRQTEINIALQESSSSNKVIVNLAYQNKNKLQFNELQKPLDQDQLSRIAESDRENRQEQLLKHVCSGIKNCRSHSMDASVEFLGDRTSKHIFNLAYGKSNVAPQSRFVALYNKKAQNPLKLSVEVKGVIPNTNGLDLAYSLENEPQAKYEMVALQQFNNIASGVKATIDMTRSERRRNQLKNQPMYETCKKQMQQGNKQLFACQNMTIESNYLDDIKVDLKFENMPPQCHVYLKSIMNALRLAAFPYVEAQESAESYVNKAQVHIQFQPEDLRQMTVTVKAEDEQTKFSNISLGKYWVPHPVFHLKSRLAAQLMKQDNIRPTCVMDQNQAQTFNNKTYPLSLDDKWNVVMQSIFRDQQQNIAILARKTAKGYKEIKLTVIYPNTKNDLIEVNLRVSNGKVTVTVGQEQVQVDQQHAAEFHNGLLEIYQLPNEEVKVEIQNWFYIIFDGKRVKITATSDKLFDSVVGLCGKFNGDQYEDFSTPLGCIVRSPNTFVQSWILEENSQQPKDCVRKQLPIYTNVVLNSKGQEQRASLNLRSRYIEQNNEICFTLSPMPQCKTQAKRTVTKNVPVHCMAKTNAYYLKNQIDQGGNPDFSHKSQTETVSMEIPQECY